MKMSMSRFTDGAGRRARGFTLVELMIAMLLGLVVTAGAVSVFLGASRTYTTNEALGEVQTNARIAFELMARDFRNAGQMPCTNNGRVANVLNNSATAWWADWGNALHGYEYGKTPSDPAITTAMPKQWPNTDSVEIIAGGTEGLSVANTPSGPAANFKLNETTNDLVSGDIIIVCDPNHAAIVQVTKQNGSNVTLVHNTGSKTYPGNCADGLGYPVPVPCTTTGTDYTFDQNSQIAKLTATDWYIGTTTLADGSKVPSLYHITLQTDSTTNTVAPVAQEMVRYVDDMQLTYHQTTGTNKDTFVSADLITSWADVDAIHIYLHLMSTNQRAGTDNAAIKRSFETTVTIRNRVS